jgi:hypothetical protein
MVTAMNAQAEDAAKAKALMLMQASRKDVLSREEVTHACARARTRTRMLAHAYNHAHSRCLVQVLRMKQEAEETRQQLHELKTAVRPSRLLLSRAHARPAAPTPPPPRPTPLLAPASHVCDTVALAVAAHVVVLRVYTVCACRARRPRGSQAQQLQQSRTSWRRWASQLLCECMS